MSAAQFKKIEKVSGGSLGPNDDRASGSELNGTLVKPGISLFHNLPKITPRETSYHSLKHEIPNGPECSSLGNSTYEDGIQEGQKKASLVYLDTIKLLETSLAALNNQYSLMRAEIEASHFKAVAQCLKAVLPQLNDLSAINQIQAFVQDLCAPTLHGKIQLHVNPKQVDAITEILNIQDNAETVIDIVPDHQIKTGNIHSYWEGGGIDLDTGSAVEQILALIDAAFAQINSKKGEEIG